MGREIQLTLNPETGVYEAVLGDDTSEAGGHLEANSAIRQISRQEIAGVPVGQVIVGAGAAGVWDLLSHFLEPMIPRTGGLKEGHRRAALKAFGSWVALTDQASGLLGEDGGKAASLILGYEASKEIFDVRKIVRDFGERIAPKAFSHAGRELGSEHAPNRAAAQAAAAFNSEAPARAALMGV